MQSESVWDYPRPPRIESSTRLVKIVCGDQVIVESRRSFRLLETSHPPTFYVPIDEVAEGVLIPASKKSLCEWKGIARYYHVVVGDYSVENAAWSYPSPQPAFLELADHVAFYPLMMDACYVNGERVQPQAGGFYGGWITSEIEGPFKGAPGTQGW